MEKLKLITAMIALCISTSGIQARSVSLKNNTNAPIKITWKNARSNATSNVLPGAIGLISIKPDKLGGNYYAVRDDAIYVSVNGKPINAFDAQEVNEYVKTLWDNDSKNDPAKFAISFTAEDISVPNVEIASHFDKAKQWFNDHKVEIGMTAAAAAAAAGGAYYASQDDKLTNEKPNFEEPEVKPATNNAIIAKYLAILGLNSSERDPKVITKSYRKLALKLHPDKGGNKEDFQEINEAHEQLQKLIGF